MQYLFNILVSFINIFTTLSLFRKEEVKKNEELLKLDLQFFADDEDPEDDLEDDSEDDPEDDGPNLDELLKDKKFKKQYNERFKQQMGKRLKKYDGIDPEEYRRLKEQAEKKDDGKDENETSKESTEKLLRAERREKRALVKEFAVDNGHNPKLLARLIDIDAIELDEKGNPENLEELFDEIEEEFPEYFAEKEEDEDEEELPSKKKKSSYVPGSPQKGNKKPNVKHYDLGKQRALARHKKEE